MPVSSLITPSIKSNIIKSSELARAFSPMSGTPQSIKIGRVTRVVLGKDSCSEDEWNLYQKSQALYGIFYRELLTGIDGQVIEGEKENFAYCSNPNLRRIPLKNEIVSLEIQIASDLSVQNQNINQNKVYWKDIVPAWNHPHLNLFPGPQNNGVEQDEYFQDNGNNINPLQLCPGDVTLEGRHGESLRFGGTSYKDSPISVQDTNGKPYAIIRVGQGVDNEGEGFRPVYEDINQDLTSLYFTTAHIIPITQAFSKRSSWKDRKVVEAKDYNKPQILLSADRVWLNGRDDVEFSAKNYVGITAEQVNVDGQEQVSLDANKIYLGSNAQSESEPVLKGAMTTKMLSDLIDQFITLLDTINKAGTVGRGDPGAFVGTLQSISKLLIPVLKTYQGQLPKLHSKKTYTE